MTDFIYELQNVLLALLVFVSTLFLVAIEGNKPNLTKFRRCNMYSLRCITFLIFLFLYHFS